MSVVDGVPHERRDDVATEEPMEIRVCTPSSKTTVSITMRTPGNDFELAAGFLFAEGMLADSGAVRGISYCTDKEIQEEQRFNVVNVFVSADVPDFPGSHRHLLTNSSCGVCGKASLESLSLRGLSSVQSAARVDHDVISRLPDRLRGAQALFDSTGGLHAAGLFDLDGAALVVREDVGRHNAVDKVLGWALLDTRLPLERAILMVSGRTSYEIVQKATSAGVPIVCSVSAPSSLAVDVAREFGITLIGFLRGDRFNIYANPDRILAASPSHA